MKQNSLIEIAEIPLSKYDEYKDSGAFWLGKIPKHWELTRLGTRFNERRAKVSDKDYPALSVTKQGIFPQLANVAKSNDGDNRKLVKAGDFVINSRSDRKGSSGISNLDGSVSLINIVLEPKRIDPLYCHFLLKSNGFIEEFYRNGHGIVADLWTTRFSEMKAIKLGIPPLKEQTQIAQFLDQKTALINQAISQKEQLIDLLKERRQILIHQAVTRGLDEDVEMKDSGVEWIGLIPKHWNIKRSKYIFSEVNERSENGEEELLSVSHMTGVTPRSEKNVYMFKAEDYSGSKLCKKDDLVINTMWAWMGALGISDRIGIVSPSYGVYRQTNPDFFNSWFLENLLRGENYIAEYNRISTGLHKSRLRLYPPMFLNLEMILPPKEEQDRIEKQMQVILKKVDSSIEKIKLQIQKLKEYKTTLINAAVTGKIKIA